MATDIDSHHSIANGNTTQRRRVYKAMGKWESLIDKLIRESMERGEFDDLAGSGKPVDLSENPFEDPELRTAHRLLRNAGFAPAFIEERKDIDAQFEHARKTLGRAKVLYLQKGNTRSQLDPLQNVQWQRAAKEFREAVNELNLRIRVYNLKSPAVVFHRKTIDADGVIRDLEGEATANDRD
jgi:DnaJ family protein C protein 28